jgi:hypothetical protein
LPGTVGGSGGGEDFVTNGRGSWAVDSSILRR